jgi:hypothetical protein
VGEEPLAETRLAIATQRTELERTADQLRDAFDIRKRFQENPAMVVGVAAGAVFLITGGPVRVAKLVRRRVFRSNPEKAYDSLPKPMQQWVDHMAGAVGPRASDARDSLANDLAQWRRDPRKHGKISKKLAQQIAEGPPGPQRALWQALEAGGAILTAALARKAVERLLAGEPPESERTFAATGVEGGASATDDAKSDLTRSSGEHTAAPRSDYSGMSSSRS